MQITDPILVYIAVLVVLCLILLLVGVVVLYLRTAKRYVDLMEGKTHELDPQILIKEAQTKSQRILDDAQFQAREVITKAQNFLTASEGLVGKEFKNATEIYQKKYEEALLATSQNISKGLQNIPEDIKKVLTAEIVNIKFLLRQDVDKAALEAKALVTDAYKKAEMEVDKYKAERMRQIDESIVMILKEVARKVLAKEISQDEHEKLVLKALEEAKKEGVFGSQTSNESSEVNKSDSTSN